MAWVALALVKGPLEKVISSTNHVDADITQSIAYAQAYASGYLRTAGISDVTMTAWETSGAPPEVQAIIVDIAQAYVLRDFYDQKIKGDSKAADLYGLGRQELLAIANGTKTLLASVNGASQSTDGDRFYRTDSARSRVFTLGSDDESGTLDNL